MYTLKEGWGTLKSIQKHASGGRGAPQRLCMLM